MRKPFAAAALAVLIATQTFAASYWVVTKYGTRYEAKTKWTVVNGKALVTLVNGTVVELDPNLIDVAKSEEVTRLGGGNLIGVELAPATSSTKQSTLGSGIRLRKLPSAQSGASTSTAPVATPSPVEAGAGLGSDVMSKFERAFENVGIFEHKIVSTGPRSLRADLTADTEDKVFNGLTATAFLMMHNAGIPGVQIDSVDLFMKTTTGGAAGRFHVTHDDAQALEAKKITPESYFVQKVLF
ncbi:MAG TPA: hypothetical protein VLC46_23555 [Thermoanaerobaculia bacterium]|jgi:hypothetical protein|nr:hypothetical protein [Thermoanaerobaculia bacterium]